MNLTRVAEQIDRDLRAIRQRLRQPVESEFARGGLTPAQRSVMQALVRANGLSLKELSKNIGLAHSTVSGVVDRLEKRGLLRREVHQDDRRVTRILPSKAVQKFLRDELPRLELNPLIEVLRQASKSERTAVLEGIAALRRLLMKS